jgi:hypothetical protein
MIPKSKRRTKPYKGLNPRGKSNRSKERQAWQQEMLRTFAHIQHCEWLGGCSSTFGLAHAHRMKKVYVKTREEWLMIARLCQTHHDLLEHGDKQVMFDVISLIISNRV